MIRMLNGILAVLLCLTLVPETCAIVRGPNNSLQRWFPNQSFFQAPYFHTEREKQRLYKELRRLRVEYRNASFAERSDMSPNIIFKLDQLQPNPFLNERFLPADLRDFSRAVRKCTF